MPGVCSFNDIWLDKSEYKCWLKKVADDKRKAYCNVCKKNIDISSMGEGALNSHAKGKKHIQNEKATISITPITGYLNTVNNAAPVPSSSKACHEQGSTAKPVNIQSFCTKTEVLTAEVIWTMKCLNSHYSFSSCRDTADCFKAMFPSCDIAQQFACAERKSAYLSIFGIAPYFADLLQKRIRAASAYVLMFDETMNKQMQEKQMDIYVRIWDANKITSFFHSSYFLGHATAANLFEKISPIILDLGHRGFLQLSMDGPAVNWKLFQLLEKEAERSSPCKLLNIGSCGLHILHNAFRNGCSAATWDVENVLLCIYYLFHDSPARREDFTTITDTTTFPLKYCKHRWLENIEPAERAILLLPNLEKYIKAVKSKTLPEPSCKSFKDVCCALADPLLKAKLHFFIVVAREFQPFLKLYQTDNPMLPFLATDLGSLIQSLLARFMKPEVMSSAKSVTSISSLDFLDIKNHMENNKINVGFSATKLLLNKDLSDRQKFSFRAECKAFLIAALKKIMEKSPIIYPLVRNMSWLDPRLMVSETDKVNGRAKLTRVLRVMCEAKRVEEFECDTIIAQYEKYVESTIAANSIEHRNFSPSKSRVDEFFFAAFHNKKEFSELWIVIQKLLLLSHGQATVERGFSLNKEVSVENLHRESLCAQRLIIDQVRRAGGPHKVQITKELLSFASSARMKYSLYLEKQKEERSILLESRKRKLELDEVEELKCKKRALEADVASLVTLANNKAKEAEVKRDFSFICASNALREKAAEKS